MTQSFPFSWNVLIGALHGKFFQSKWRHSVSEGTFHSGECHGVRFIMFISQIEIKNVQIQRCLREIGVRVGLGTVIKL
jgi:hypothetical protein